MTYYNLLEKILQDVVFSCLQYRYQFAGNLFRRNSECKIWRK